MSRWYTPDDGSRAGGENIFESIHNEFIQSFGVGARYPCFAFQPGQTHFGTALESTANFGFADTRALFKRAHAEKIATTKRKRYSLILLPALPVCRDFTGCFAWLGHCQLLALQRDQFQQQQDVLTFHGIS